MTPRLPTTLVTGASPGEREAAIARALAATPAASPGAALILEGLPDGRALLPATDSLAIHRIAPGCLCCTGNLVLRVTLNRVLRRPPGHLFIGLASNEHLDQLRSWLMHRPYDQLLDLTPDLKA